MPANRGDFIGSYVELGRLTPGDQIEMSRRVGQQLIGNPPRQSTVDWIVNGRPHGLRFLRGSPYGRPILEMVAPLTRMNELHEVWMLARQSELNGEMYELAPAGGFQPCED